MNPGLNGLLDRHFEDTTFSPDIDYSADALLDIVRRPLIGNSHSLGDGRRE